MTDSPLLQWLDQRSRVRTAKDRERRAAAPSRPPRIDLASNDYLGLARDQRLAEAAAHAARAFGAGASASRVVTGTHPVHEDVEAALCRLTGRSSALVFSSGYTANLAVMSALSGPGTLQVLDEHAHASLRDGARVGRSPQAVFAHQDLAELERLLADRSQPRAMVVVESIYSVLGDRAPLADLHRICRAHGALLVVDEAHSLGVVPGRCAVAEDDLAEAEDVIVTATLSKALGAQGGVILGGGAAGELVRRHFVSEARSFIFDTGLAPAAAAAALEACRIIENDPDVIARLHRNSARVRAALTRFDDAEPGAGAVHSVPAPSAAVAVELTERLAAEGIAVGCFRPPSTPDGRSRLRVTASAGHRPAELFAALDRVVAVLAEARGEAPTAEPRWRRDALPDYVHVTDPDLVREVLTRTDEFEPTNALTAAVALTPDALRTLARSGFALPPVLASATGELHRTTRRAVTGFFSPARVEAVVPLIRQLARAAAEQVAARPDREVDLGAAVADHLPARVMAEMMGTPLPDRDDLHRWSRDSLELFWGTPSPDRQLHLAGSAAAFHTWLRGVVRASIAADGDDLWATVARTGVSERQVCSLAYFLMIAGQETTSMLTRTVLLRALQDRPTWAGAGADVAAAREVTRQVLAEESSVPTWRRRVGADTTLDGCPLSAGTEVLLEVSGHHRPGDRDGFGLAFGHGLHRCLGAALAETEATHILHETARALPGARWSGAEPAWWRLLSFRTPLTVPALI